MVTAQLLLWIELPNISVRDRLVFYLDPESRPDFPEEVLADESSWVSAFELLPDPSELTRPDDLTLLVYFDDETDADPHGICAAIDLFSPVQLLSWENIEGEIYFQRWKAGENTLIYAPQGLDNPEDDKKYNQVLNKEIRIKLDSMSRQPEQALAFLAAKYSEDGQSLF